MALRFLYGDQPEKLDGFQLAQASLQDGGGHLNGPIDDIQLRSWGIQLVDGRMPGFAAIVGCAKSNEVAVKIIRELQRRNILTFLAGNVNGRSIIHQLQEEGIEMGYDTFIVPFGTDTLSASYAIGFATRSALTFGGMKGGQSREILLYNRARVFAFVLALGEVDDLKYAAAAGAISYGFPAIADTVIPEIHPTGVTSYEHVVSMPFNEIPGKDDLERAEKLIQRCIEVRGVKIKMTEVPIPVPYGSAFEGEVVRKADLRFESGGKKSRAFEYLYMLPMEKVEDGKVTVHGPTSIACPKAALWILASSPKLPDARCKKISSRCWNARFTTLSTARPAFNTSVSATLRGFASANPRTIKDSAWATSARFCTRAFTPTLARLSTRSK